MRKPAAVWDSLFAVEEKAQDDAKAAALEAEREALRDLVGERLIELGYVANEYTLHANHSLGDWGSNKEMPPPWCYPSRTFIWPLETENRYHDEKETWVEGQTKLGLKHPLLADHPLVLKLRADGFEVNPNGAYLFDTMRDNGWFHACDLCTEEHWEKLIETRRFTTDNNIINAIEFHLSHKRNKKPELTVPTARKILAILEKTEPGNKQLWRSSFDKPRELNYEKRKSWPINSKMKYPITAHDKLMEAWGKIQGIEQGIFEFNGDFLGWSKKGRESHGQKDGNSVDDKHLEPDTGMQPNGRRDRRKKNS